MKMGPIEELDQLVSRLLDRSLSESEASRLNALLSDSPVARDRYQELLDNHEALCAIYPGDVYEASINVADPLPTPVDSGKDRSQRVRAIVRWVPWMTTAAVVLIAAVLQFSPNEDEPPISGAPAPSSALVARLVAAVDADWRGAEPLPGAFLEAGSFQLDAGAVELEFNDGARVTLRGPTAFELKSANHLHVLSGHLVAQIPEKALGFLVTTPQSAIIDLGTEFGLVVDDAGQTDVHVIDGLVEVYERRNPDEVTSSEAVQAGIKIHEGEGRRLKIDGGLQIVNVPFSSRHEILSKQGPRELAFHLLRGNIHLNDSISALDLTTPTSGPSWIEVIPEKSGVLLAQETAVTFRAPGNYRFFGAKNEVISAGTNVDSYLLHFRSTGAKPIRGVIKFDRPIVGLICEANQLAGTDAIVGLADVSYPVAAKNFRGLEPHFPHQQLDAAQGKETQAVGGGWSPDEVTLSQDMTTLGLSVNVMPNQGVDQLRVLILSKD
jgi:hypothetical protein